MLFGMGTVFVFLTILVFGTSLMSKIVERYFPEQEAADIPGPIASPAASNAQAVDGKTLNIIQQAIYQHRAKIK